MKRVIHAVTEAHEVSFVPKGACPEATVVLRKSADETPAEIQKMDTKIAKALLGFDETTKAYALSLDDAGLTAFAAKSAEDQAAEVAAAKAAKKPPFMDDEDEKKKAADAATAKAAADAATAQANKSAADIEIEKGVQAALKPMQDELNTMKAAAADALILKRAETEFADYPGGPEAAMATLKGVATADEATRKAVEAGMTAQCLAAKAATGGTSARVIRKGSAMEELNTLATARKEAVIKSGAALPAGGIDVLVIKGEILQADDALLAKAFDEEGWSTT